MIEKDIKVNVQEFCDFLNQWRSKKWYFDDFNEEYHLSHIGFNGSLYFPVKSNEMLSLNALDGSIEWQGMGNEPHPRHMAYTLKQAFLDWRESQKFGTLTIKLPKEEINKAKDFLRESFLNVEILGE